MKVAVLMGGNSAERDVSLASGAAVVSGLRKAGHSVIAFDTGSDGSPLTDAELAGLAAIKEKPPDPQDLLNRSSAAAYAIVGRQDIREADIVFNILHGGYGENGTIQAVMDLLNIPYTGSGMLASALAMDKHLAKQVFRSEGIATPDDFHIDGGTDSNIAEIDRRIRETIGYPVIVKPNCQGSSVGLSKINSRSDIEAALESGFAYDTHLLFEKYIAGRDFTVSILGDRPLPVVEIIAGEELYDYEHKYMKGKTRKVCPPELPEKIQQAIQEAGLKAFRAIGCAGFGRVDCRLTDDGRIYCFEVNTLPGMTETSLVPMAARAAGIDFPQLLEKICLLGIADFKRKKR